RRLRRLNGLKREGQQTTRRRARAEVEKPVPSSVPPAAKTARCARPSRLCVRCSCAALACLVLPCECLARALPVLLPCKGAHLTRPRLLFSRGVPTRPG